MKTNKIRIFAIALMLMVMGAGTALAIVIPVDVDVKPGSDPNSINLDRNGVISVAILGSADFDVYDVDPETVRFTGAAPLRWAIEDVNEDGFEDMVFKFKIQELGLTSTSTVATLEGETVGGILIEGSDAVRIVPTD